MSEPMPARFEELARYNAAMAPRVIELGPAPEIHPDAKHIEFEPADRSQFPPEHHERMARLQEEFNAWSRQKTIREAPPGSTIIETDGGLLILPPGAAFGYAAGNNEREDDPAMSEVPHYGNDWELDVDDPIQRVVELVERTPGQKR